MNFTKLKLKKSSVMELSNDIESLPLDKTNLVGGGATTSQAYCATLINCPTTDRYTEEHCLTNTYGHDCADTGGDTGPGPTRTNGCV